MHTNDFHIALKIARHYFERRGVVDRWALRDVGAHVMRAYQKGEHRPLVIANKAIRLMERQYEIKELRRIEAEALFALPLVT